MNRTAVLFALIVVMLGGAAWVTWTAFRGEDDRVVEPAPDAPVPARPAPPPTTYERHPDQPVRSGTDAPPTVPAEPVELPSMVALAESLNDPDATVEEDLEVVEGLLQHFQRTMKSAPFGGLNEEIVASLRGRNARKFIYIAEGNAKLNEKGELVDRFGTPYFFHPVSEKLIQVRSAGPDRKLFTDDDVWLGEGEP